VVNEPVAPECLYAVDYGVMLRRSSAGSMSLIGMRSLTTFSIEPAAGQEGMRLCLMP
jgi:hypothetical protein